MHWNRHCYKSREGPQPPTSGMNQNNSCGALSFTVAKSERLTKFRDTWDGQATLLSSSSILGLGYGYFNIKGSSPWKDLFSGAIFGLCSPRLLPRCTPSLATPWEQTICFRSISCCSLLCKNWWQRLVLGLKVHQGQDSFCSSKFHTQSSRKDPAKLHTQQHPMLNSQEEKNGSYNNLKRN